MNILLSRLPTAAAVVMLDERLSIIHSNSRFAQMSGGDILCLCDIVTEQSRGKLLQCAHCAAAGQERTCTLELSNRARTVFSCSPVDDGDPSRLLCLFTDVSKLSEAAAENKLWTSRLCELASLCGGTLAVCTDDGNVRYFGSLFPSGGECTDVESFVLLLRDSGYLHKGDCTALADFIKSAANGSEIRQLSVRLRFDNLNYTQTTLTGTYSTICSPPSFMMFFPSGSGGGESLISDPVTGVLSLLSIECIVRRALETQPSAAHSLILIELGRYKQLNESRGRQFGDAVMRDICRTVSDNLGKNDVLGRYSGAVLCVFCRELDDINRVYTLAEKLRSNIDEIYGERASGFALRCSIGVAVTSGQADTCTELFRRADVDLFKSKSRLHSRYGIL